MICLDKTFFIARNPFPFISLIIATFLISCFFFFRNTFQPQLGNSHFLFLFSIFVFLVPRKFLCLPPHDLIEFLCHWFYCPFNAHMKDFKSNIVALGSVFHFIITLLISSVYLFTVVSLKLFVPTYSFLVVLSFIEETKHFLKILLSPEIDNVMKSFILSYLLNAFIPSLFL